MIYLDSAATTKPKQEVINAMLPYFEEKWFNPSSLYMPSQLVKKTITDTQKTVADFINAKPEEIYFTSGGSESNCWAIQGFCNYWHNQYIVPIVVTSEIEHNSVLECVESTDVRHYKIGVDENGFIKLNELESILQTNFPYEIMILVSIQFANNEIGTIQNIKEIADIVHKNNGIFHTDAVQAFGHIDIDVNELGIDMLSASGHKIGTPKGVGILYKKSNIPINPIIYGTQMNGLRGGTENVPYIVGFGEAVELSKKDLADEKTTPNKLILKRNHLIYQLKKIFDCQINGSFSNRLANNINVTFKQNITGEALIYLLDLCDIYISAGSACNSHSNVPSHVLTAIGLTDEEAAKTVRITLPDDITFGQLDKFINELEKQIKLLTMKL